MISKKFKIIFLISIPVFIAHGLEEYFTGFYNVDSFFGYVFKSFNAMSVPQATFLLFQIQMWFLLTVVALLIVGERWRIRILVLLGLLYIFELHHIIKSVLVRGYYPGVVTALVFPILGYHFWKEYLMNQKMRHFENNIRVPACPQEVFDFVNDHTNLSSHMSQSSWMMGGGRMEIQIDQGRGQTIGSHIRLKGKVLGITLLLDEVITQYDPPYQKTWRTVDDINLLVIGHYHMGFEIKPEQKVSVLKVFIDYELPTSAGTRLLGYLLGDQYAKWCVKKMLKSAKEHFTRHEKESKE